jgi:radical SAM/Cys-rich protein
MGTESCFFTRVYPLPQPARNDCRRGLPFMTPSKFHDKILSLRPDPLRALDLKILQVNLGYRCNLACKHCHVSAGPGRTEAMDGKTVDAVLRAFLDNPFEILDITGGSPELNPHFRALVAEARKAGRHVIVRTNLAIFFEHGMDYLPRFYRDNGVELVASLPYYIEDGVDRVRGSGTFKKSIAALKVLNGLGYGNGALGTPLSLVYNPQGMFLAPAQCTLEAEYRRELGERFGISFTRLYTFTNMPVGRFREFLVRTGNLEKYTNTLSSAFNPLALDGIMCRHLLNVGWDGVLYDCDFNQVLGLAVLGDGPRHIRHFDYNALLRRRIAVDDHCFGCTAGQGST